MKEEFILADDLTVDGKIHKKGTKCPDSEIGRLLKHNKEYLILEYKDGWPVITEPQQKKYGVQFPPKVTQLRKIPKRDFDQEKLTVKLAELGSQKFKEWAETNFGEDFVDRRKGPRKIIYDILAKQNGDRR